MRYNELMNLVQKADAFAEKAHSDVNQVRKYTGEPYINHPREVRAILKKYASGPISPEQEAAALLHDTVEDTNVTAQQIEQEFGHEVANLVGWLTDVSKLEDGNRKIRKNIDLQHTAAAPAAAQSIKCCDLVSNTLSIVKHDKNFAVVYLKEKRELLKVLVRADPGVLKLAHQVLEQAERDLQLSK